MVHSHCLISKSNVFNSHLQGIVLSNTAIAVYSTNHAVLPTEMRDLRSLYKHFGVASMYYNEKLATSTCSCKDLKLFKSAVC